jgi:hypothetical protein
MNPVSDKYRLRLTNLLKELFQLDQPELDFGLYKIMHLKSEQITRFLENDLLKEIEQAFGEKETVDAAALKESAIGKLTEALGVDALDEHGKLQEAFAKLPAGKKYLEEIAAAETAKDALNAESKFMIISTVFLNAIMITAILCRVATMLVKAMLAQLLIPSPMMVVKYICIGRIRISITLRAVNT